MNLNLKIDKKFLNFHLLTSYSPSCLNRDDMNMQKSALFGGVRRVRVSSQCLKRSIRTSELYKELFGSSSIRTTDPEKLFNYIKTQELFKDVPDEILKCVIGNGMKEKTMTPWVIDEIKKLSEAVDALLTKHNMQPSDLPALMQTKSDETAKKGKKSDSPFMKELQKVYKENDEEFKKAGISAADIALSGRMCASGDLSNVEAALSIAHAISTHAMEAEIDWFTAMDDLRIEAEETGAGHLNTQEFSAAVFYLYASINLELLAENIGGTEQEALTVASKYLELMATVSPTAKQKSFASYSPAYCIFSLHSPLPISLANAFEKPVKLSKGNGFLAPSVKAIEDYWATMHKKYQIAETGALFCMDDEQKWDGVSICPTLSDMKQWIEKGLN